MSTSTLHPVATAYLQQVRREGRDLPSDRLAELLIDLEEHLSAAIPVDVSEEDAREVVRRFGDPREIIAAERPELVVHAERRGTRVLPGGLFATVVLLALALGRARKAMCIHYGAGVVHCTYGPSSGPSTLGSIALVLLALTPIATAVYLARRAR